jgi:hypothetical protein
MSDTRRILPGDWGLLCLLSSVWDRSCFFAKVAPRARSPPCSPLVGP